MSHIPSDFHYSRLLCTTRVQLWTCRGHASCKSRKIQCITQMQPWAREAWLRIWISRRQICSTGRFSAITGLLKVTYGALMPSQFEGFIRWGTPEPTDYPTRLVLPQDNFRNVVCGFHFWDAMNVVELFGIDQAQWHSAGCGSMILLITWVKTSSGKPLGASFSTAQIIFAQSRISCCQLLRARSADLAEE